MSVFNPNDALIVSWDFTHGKDSDILLVGRRIPMEPIGHRVEVINAFQGDEARAVFEMLTRKKEAPNGN
jgi:hypothetical protein